MLDLKNAIRVELKDFGTQKGGKYRRRRNVYTFLCECGEEIHATESDIKRLTGRCRKCSDKRSAVLSSLRNRIRPYEALYNKFKYDRERFSQDNGLTYDEFVELTKVNECHYCGSEVTWAVCSINKNGQHYNLDRKDNTRGYLYDNVVVCCWECNQTKSNRYTYAEFMMLSPALHRIKRLRAV